MDGKYGTIELFLLPGNTPMLCGRPIIEALGMSMDFARRLLRIGGSPWQSATLGRQGEYLWSITHEHDLMQYDPMKPNFELRTNEPDVHQIDGYTLPDFIKEEKVFTSMDVLRMCPSSLASTTSRRTSSKPWMCNSTRTSTTSLPS